jgi:hypothetical protein
MAKLDPLKTNEPGAGPKILSPAAQRALAEAEERRQAERLRRASGPADAKEIGGREGPDPARYGDWEVKGIVSDF